MSKIPMVFTDPWNFTVSLPLVYAHDTVNCELKFGVIFLNVVWNFDSSSSAYTETIIMKLGYTCASGKEKMATWFVFVASGAIWNADCTCELTLIPCFLLKILWRRLLLFSQHCRNDRKELRCRGPLVSCESGSYTRSVFFFF